jgi:hypothetical protein
MEASSGVNGKRFPVFSLLHIIHIITIGLAWSRRVHDFHRKAAPIQGRMIRQGRGAAPQRKAVTASAGASKMSASLRCPVFSCIMNDDDAVQEKMYTAFFETTVILSST